jgi:DNA replication protein DnaC
MTVKHFRDLIANGPKWVVLVLFGGVGTGKTLVASELAESLINGLSMSVRYCTAKQMIAEIQAAYSSEGKTEEGEILRFVQYNLLILDEIDAKPDRENANLLLTEVINRRYNAEAPVVVITNQPFDGLARFVGDRVDDRLHENAFVCSFDWPSFRRTA